MPFANYDLLICPGESFSLPLVWETGSPATSVDPTGYHAFARFIDANDAGVVLTEVSDADGQVVLAVPPSPQTTPPTPNITVKLTSIGSAKIQSSGRWELVMISSGGQETPLLSGQVVKQLRLGTP